MTTAAETSNATPRKRGRHSGKRDYFVHVQWPLLSDTLDVAGWPSPDELKRIERGWRNGDPAATVSDEIISERRKLKNPA